MGLEKVIGRRVGKKALGFRAVVDPDVKDGDVTPIRAQRDSELLRQAEPQDLLKYGLIPEFVGRLPVMGILDELDEAALIEILTKPRNAILKAHSTQSCSTSRESRLPSPTRLRVQSLVRRCCVRSVLADCE